VCLWLCTSSVHNTTQNSSDNLPSCLQTTIIAQMLSQALNTQDCMSCKQWNYSFGIHLNVHFQVLTYLTLSVRVCEQVNRRHHTHTKHDINNRIKGSLSRTSLLVYFNNDQLLQLENNANTLNTERNRTVTLLFTQHVIKQTTALQNISWSESCRQTRAVLTINI